MERNQQENISMDYIVLWVILIKNFSHLYIRQIVHKKIFPLNQEPYFMASEAETANLINILHWLDIWEELYHKNDDHVYESKKDQHEILFGV